MGFRDYDIDQESLFTRLRGMYDAQSELMQESFARMDQLLSREIAREREMFEDDIATQRLEDCQILSEETYSVEGEAWVFGSARFRRLIRQSNVVTIMTYFESSLAEVTKLLLEEANTRRVGTAPGLRLQDFGHRNSCHKCRVALTRYIGLTDNRSLWGQLQDFVTLRNLIVHQGGNVPVASENGHTVPEDKATKRILKNLQSKGLAVLNSGELVIEPQLCELQLQMVRDYLLYVLDQASQHFTPPKAVTS